MFGKFLCKIGLHKNFGYWTVLPIAEKVQKCKRCGLITLQTDDVITYLTEEEVNGTED